MLGMMYTNLWEMVISGNQNWGERERSCFLFKYLCTTSEILKENGLTFWL